MRTLNRNTAIYRTLNKAQEQRTMRAKTIAVLGTLALGLGLAAPAGAASVVDITYDLSDTAFNGATLSPCPVHDGCIDASLLSSSMKIRYTSNSASSMPILHGPATLQSLTLQAKFTWVTQSAFSFSTANANVKLVSPVPGSLLSSGTLTFGAAQIRVTGTRHCYVPASFAGGCIVLAGTLTSVFGPLGPFTTTGPLSFAASAGPYGGAHSTRQTVSGTIPAYVPTTVTDIFLNKVLFATSASVVGREVLREAEGHDPKVTPIPEPGTLLLLGTGTVGLALVGRATRRARRS